MDHFIEMLGMNEFLHLSARKLSLGQRMRADLAAALLHNPQTVYLDEPTIGLDVAVKQKIREFIKTMNREHGTTIYATTHDLGDIENLCKRLIIIDHGRIIYNGSIEAVKDRFARERTIHFEMSASASDLHSTLQFKPGMELINVSEKEFSIRFDRFHTTASEVVTHILSLGEIEDFRIDEPDIEHIIKRVYEGQLDLSEA